MGNICSITTEEGSILPEGFGLYDQYGKFYKPVILEYYERLIAKDLVRGRSEQKKVTTSSEITDLDYTLSKEFKQVLDDHVRTVSNIKSETDFNDYLSGWKSKIIAELERKATDPCQIDIVKGYLNSTFKKMIYTDYFAPTTEQKRKKKKKQRRKTKRTSNQTCQVIRRDAMLMGNAILENLRNENLLSEMYKGAVNIFDACDCEFSKDGRGIENSTLFEWAVHVNHKLHAISHAQEMIMNIKAVSENLAENILDDPRRWAMALSEFEQSKKKKQTNLDEQIAENISSRTPRRKAAIEAMRRTAKQAGVKFRLNNGKRRAVQNYSENDEDEDETDRESYGSGHFEKQKSVAEDRNPTSCYENSETRISRRCRNFDETCNHQSLSASSSLTNALPNMARESAPSPIPTLRCRQDSLDTNPSQQVSLIPAPSKMIASIGFFENGAININLGPENWDRTISFMKSIIPTFQTPNSSDAFGESAVPATSPSTQPLQNGFDQLAAFDNILNK
ncbi:unnamed protein product [Caenorhabditis bovis]|uniref:Uncharacterized protein n=1 Tax=Caenorhabditis bovis TaxID=2654633 RepID=A0A8S1F9L0_9PELO|nr:unnamed protein product [Caenorhabditis bovis]